MCYLYSEEQCYGEVSEPIVRPGAADLAEVGWNDRVESWRCWQVCDQEVPAISITATLGLQTGMSEGQVPTPTITKTPPPASITTQSLLSPDGTRSESAISIKKTLPAASLGTKGPALVPSITKTEGAPPSMSTSAGSAVSITETLGFPPTEITRTSRGISIMSPASPPLAREDAAGDLSITRTLSGPQSPVTTSFASSTIPSNTDTFSAPSGNATSSSSLQQTPSTIPTSATSSPTPPMLPTPAGVGMFTSWITMTHTYVDGSLTTVVTSLVEPILPTPAAS